MEDLDLLLRQERALPLDRFERRRDPTDSTVGAFFGGWALLRSQRGRGGGV